MANDLRSFLLGGLNRMEENRDINQQLQFYNYQWQMQLKNLIDKAIIENQIKRMQMQENYKLLQDLLDGGQPSGQTGFMPYYNNQGQDIGNMPNLNQQPMQQPAQRYRFKPTISLSGEGNLGLNFSQEETPEYQRQQKVLEQKETERAKGIPTSEAGKATLARESIKNIEDVKKILFPTGSAESYERDIATGSNIPLSQLPLIPSNFGGYNSQTIFRKMGAALSGRQLIQTGVAARPEETLKLIRQFAPSGLMSSKSALEGLNELQQFYTDYLNILETRGLDEADSWAKGQSNQSTQNNQAIPQYNPQYQKLQRNTRTGKYRVVPKNTR